MNREDPNRVIDADYIVLESSREYPKQTIPPHYQGILHSLRKRAGLGQRLLYLFLALASSFAWVVVAVLFSFTLVSALLTFFQVSEINRFLNGLWTNLKRLTILSCGFFLAIISPSMGLSMLYVYFFLKDSIKGSIHTFLKKRVYNP